MYLCGRENSIYTLVKPQIILKSAFLNALYACFKYIKNCICYQLCLYYEDASLLGGPSFNVSRWWNSFWLWVGQNIKLYEACCCWLTHFNEARKVIFPGPVSNLFSPACKSGALLTEPPSRQFCLWCVPIYHSELYFTLKKAPEWIFSYCHCWYLKKDMWPI